MTARAAVLARWPSEAPPVHRLLGHARAEDRPFALRSGSGDRGLSTWSYAALEPSRALPDFGEAHRATVPRGSGAPVDGTLSLGAASTLRVEAPAPAYRPEDDGLPPFTGGAVGYIGYDEGWRWAARPRVPRPDPLGMPSQAFLLYDAIYARNERTGEGLVLFEGSAESERRARRLASALRRPGRALQGRIPAPLSARVGQARHEARVGAALEAIRAGEVYQLNLTYPLEGRFAGEPAAAFARLAPDAPPFAAYLQVGEDAHILSASPECLLDLERSGWARTFPIKGTRPRGQGREDQEEALRLRRDPKEMAEHTMIVDLLRNDLGRVARSRSVEVPRLAYVESFPTVHHLSSEVRGFLRPGLTPEELVQAILPGGSITGAPKLSAMELIDALEEEARGVYTGTVMWIDRSGAMRASIAIRTAQIHRGELRFGVGGGIVADSDPSREWAETQLKAQALTRALS